MGLCFDELRLPQSRQALQQHMAVGEQCDQQLIDHLLLADHRGREPGSEIEDVFVCRHYW